MVFCGTTRDVEKLEYEAYAEMAEERIATILGECVAAHGLEAAAAEHRVGTVPLGEPSVIVAVSAAHRGEAFAGAREAIDRIKAEAPIWKREVEGDERALGRGHATAGRRRSPRLTHLDDSGQRPHGRRRPQAGDRAPGPRRGAGADDAGDGRGAGARRRARRATCSAPRGSPGSARRSAPAS